MEYGAGIWNARIVFLEEDLVGVGGGGVGRDAGVGVRLLEALGTGVRGL